ncbi:hypothetical protein [Haloferax sp. YSMS24]|uniref:hypothetical protein n=1 Tax=Haloferax sp. YSMS24 TaxID=3388425 RepID=UPI00398D68CE
MSVQSFHAVNGQPPVFEQHAEERYQERTPVENPIPMHDAYFKSLRCTIEDDCEARVYPAYDIVFVKRGSVVKTELVADYDRMTVQRAISCEGCGKPFETDLHCPYCGTPLEGQQTDGVIKITFAGGE